MYQDFETKELKGYKGYQIDMEETRLSWLSKWYLSNSSINMNTEFDIRVHYEDGRKTDIKGKGGDDIVLYVLGTTEEKDVIWITQYPQTNQVSIGIQNNVCVNDD